MSVDRERAAITARSILANVDVLGGEGLDAASRDAVLDEAGRLTEATTTPTALDDTSVVGLARSLGERLAAVPGTAAKVLVSWLDDVVDPEV